MTELLQYLPLLIPILLIEWGHESIEITYQYAHLFPSKQTEMANKLDDLGKGDFENVG